MNEENTTVALPKWFWIVGGIALLWNVMGMMAYFAQVMMSDEAMAKLPAEQQELFRNMPMWVTVCFTIAVFTGVIASVLLLMRKKWAFPVYIISMLAIAGQMSYMFFLSNTVEVMGGYAAMVLPVLILVIAIALVPYSKFCVDKGWLN